MSAEYSFRVTGRLTPAVLQVLHPLTAVEATTDTMLMGPVIDRSALHGLIARIEALGLELVELQRLPPSGFVNGSCPRCGRESGASCRDEQ